MEIIKRPEIEQSFEKTLNLWIIQPKLLPLFFTRDCYVEPQPPLFFIILRESKEVGHVFKKANN